MLNNRISEYLMTRLNEAGIPTHFLRRLNMREQLVREVEIIPLEVVVRNVAAGSLATRFGLTEGTPLPRSIIEFYYKSDALNDPMVSEEHITAFGWAATQEIDEVMNLALRINDFLSGLFLGVGLRLVDFKVEFGRLWEGEDMRIVLADEISPDCAGCGISRPTRSSTRIASAAISATSRKPIRRWPGASASCPKAAPATSRGPTPFSERSRPRLASEMDRR